MKPTPVLVAASFLTVALVSGCTDKCERLCQKFDDCFEPAAAASGENKNPIKACLQKCNQERKSTPDEWNHQWKRMEPYLDGHCDDLLAVIGGFPTREEMDEYRKDLKFDLDSIGGPIEIKDPPAESPPEDTKEADPSHEITPHMKALIGLMKKHKNDCDKLVAELVAYAEKHRDEIEDLVERSRQLMEIMSEKERKQYQQNLVKRWSPLTKESLDAMDELEEKCPDHLEKIVEAMIVLK